MAPPSRNDAGDYLVAATGLAQTCDAVGRLDNDRILRSARGAAALKGRPWSQTEYAANLHAARASLELAGATAVQLARFDALTRAAPVFNGGFNDWSGN